MSEARPLTPSHSDVINEGLLGDSLRVELEPDHVQKISHLASPAGQNGPEDPGEADSDSGDSLFLTQRCVPEAVRTRRKRAPDFMSDFRSRGNPEFYEDQTSSPVSDEDPKLVKKTWKRKRYKLPKYKFSFLSKTRKQGSTVLPTKQNIKLHNYAMGGFFNCVQEMWKSYRKLESQMSSLPTVDMNGEDISPISEEEEGKEESLEDRDFKVVRKKQLVVSLKPKRSQPWYSPKESEVRQQKSTADDAGCVSEGRRHSTICKVPAWAPLKRITLPSDTDSSDDAGGLVQTEAPKTQMCLELGRENAVFRQKENAEQLGYDSDAPVCGPSPEKRSRKVAEAAVPERHADAGWESESQNLPKAAENGTLCSEARVKQRKKKKGKGRGNYEGVLGGNGQSGEEAERQHAAAEEPSSSSQVVNEPSISDSKRKKKNKADDIRPELEDQRDERVEGGKKGKGRGNYEGVLGGNGQSGAEAERQHAAAEEPSSSSQVVNEPSISDSKRKKKNKADDIRPELEGQCDERVGGCPVVSLNVDSSGKKKDVNDRVGQSDRGEMKKERKKKKALEDTSDVPQTTTEHSEENAQGTSESSTVKRKKLKKKKRLSASNNGIQFEEDARVEVDRPSDVITVTDFSAPVSGAPEEDEDVGNTQKITEILEEQDRELLTKKKKRKKKKKEIREKSKSEDSIAQSDDLAFEWKKERERTPSFLVADGEEEAGQTDAPHDRGAEKPDISTGRLASESPDITDSLNRSKYGLKKKKKRKRSAAEEGAEREKDLEEGDTASPGAVGLTEAWLKEKKKRKRSRSVQMSPVEGWETAADVGHFHTDEAVVLRTKKERKKKLQAATEDAESEKSSLNARSSLSPKEKAKRGHSTETLAHISSAHERETRDPDISSSLSSPKKHKKAKRRLHNPSEDFLTEQ